MKGKTVLIIALVAAAFIFRKKWLPLVSGFLQKKDKPVPDKIDTSILIDPKVKEAAPQTAV